MTQHPEHEATARALIERFDDLADVLTGFAALHFDRRAKVAGTGDAVDAIAVGMNMLGEELQHAVVRRSELEAANAALARSNAQLTATLQSIPDALLDLDEAGRFHKIWARDPAVLAAREEMLLGRTVDEVLPTAAAAEVMATIRETLEFGESRGRKIAVQVATGVRHFELSAARQTGTAETTARVTLLGRDITDHVEAVAKQHAAERLAVATINALPSQTCVLDRHGLIISVNAAWRNFAAANGATATLVWEGCDYLAACRPRKGHDLSGQTGVLEGLQSVLRGEVQFFEHEYPCHSPTEPRWFILRVTRFDGGGPAQALVEHVDITARKLQELRAEQANALAHMGSFERHLPDGDVYWSDELLRIYGIAAGTKPERNHGYRAQHPSDRQRYLEIVMAAEAGAPLPASEFDHRIVRPDGEVRWLASKVHVVEDSAGKPMRLIGASVDITDRKHAEETLREIEHKLRLALEASGHALVEYDVRTGVAVWSREAAAMLEYEPEEVVHHERTTFAQLLHPEDRDATLAELRHYLAGLTTHYDTAYRFRAKSGAWKWLSSVGAVIERTADDKPCRFVFARADIDERKRAELAVAQSLREKETLLRELHHRVKNNLQIVDSLLRIRARKVTDPGAVAAFGEARDQVGAMALVHERLYAADDLARIDLGAYTTALVGGLTKSFAGAGGRVDVQVAATELLLPIEVVQPLGLLLNELVTNALKHAFVGRAPGSIRVGLRLDGDTLQLTVADDGVGMAQTPPAHENTTFGLQLLASLAQQIEATLEYADGPGTSVTMTLSIGRYLSHPVASTAEPA